MSADRPVARAMLRLAVLAGGAFAGYLLLSLFGGPAQAEDDPGPLDGVSATASTVTESLDEASTPVDQVVEETAGVALGSEVDQLTDQLDGAVGATLDTAERAVEPVVERAAPVVDAPVVEEAAEPLDRATPPGDEPAEAPPAPESEPAPVQPAGRDTPPGPDTPPGNAVESEPAAAAEPELAPAAVPAGTAPSRSLAPPRSPVPVPELASIPQVTDRRPPPGPLPAWVPRAGSGQLAAGAADPTPPSPGTPTEPRLPDAGSGRALLHEDVTGSGLVMPVSAPPG